MFLLTHLRADKIGQIDRRDVDYLDRFKIIVETVRLLVDHGADVNALYYSHSTPLHLASSQGILEAVQILIKHGADVNAQNETNLTPLHLASLLGDIQIVQLLIDHGADVTAKDWNDQTPLHFASSWVSADTASFMFYLKADLNVQDQETNKGSQLDPDAKAETVRLLIKHGADVTTQDKTHATPLHMASSFRLAESARILIECGADIHAHNESHSTPLHLASSSVGIMTLYPPQD